MNYGAYGDIQEDRDAERRRGKGMACGHFSFIMFFITSAAALYCSLVICSRKYSNSWKSPIAWLLTLIVIRAFNIEAK